MRVDAPKLLKLRWGSMIERKNLANYPDTILKYVFRPVIVINQQKS